MTSEVIVMNKSAIAIAADSASTVSNGDPSLTGARYFKGTNKIFELSNIDPVGIMIYNAAEINDIPWELLIKAYRKNLSTKNFNTLAEYCEDFFNYINNFDELFQDHEMKEYLFNEIINVAVFLATNITKNPEYIDASTEDRPSVILKIISKDLEIIKEHPLPNYFTDQDVEQAMVEFKDRLTQGLQESLEDAAKQGDTSLSALLDSINELDNFSILSISTFFKHYSYFKEQSSTGLVFMGFGQSESFPSYYEKHCLGYVFNRFIIVDKEYFNITRNKGATIAAFAQDSMVNTFVLGISAETSQAYTNFFKQEITEFAQSLVAEMERELPENILDLLEHSHQKYIKHTRSLAFEMNFSPLRDVIKFLPIKEMAHLAETMISLQSLKEKFTSPTETVSGPVDVAIITKNEGLVWLNRKHFFDLELNSRYTHRQSREFN
ncbi:hypothetical protein WH96_03940 [Kiloniella spongiae]|uniref:Uncharacterized protein n=1 Tax=Kiloniella spongiae TaxID=1489064 RepID=A0A0H2MLD1_9PROT|nr:hypothetical protein [Kiloniella spongiae]KLN61537.1 hypothetical protein WH96_03940 [Kiloniella spongiae]